MDMTMALYIPKYFVLLKNYEQDCIPVNDPDERNPGDSGCPSVAGLKPDRRLLDFFFLLKRSFQCDDPYPSLDINGDTG